MLRFWSNSVSGTYQALGEYFNVNQVIYYGLLPPLLFRLMLYDRKTRNHNLFWCSWLSGTE